MADSTVTKPPANAPVADRLKSLRDRLGDPTLARKPYRMGLISTKEKPCPAWAPTIGGFAFHRESSTSVEDEFGKDQIVKNAGIVAMLTDDEAALLRSRMKDYIIRWRSRGAFIAEFLDAAAVDLKGKPIVQINPETDELAEPYLSLTAL